MTDAKPQRKISSSLECWFSEIQKADMRLRRFPDVNGRPNPHHPRAAAMRWALSLARIDLESLSEGDFSNLQRELACFSRFEMEPPDTHKLWGEPGPWLMREQVMAVQQWLRTRVEQIENRQDVQFTEPSRTWFVYYSKEQQEWKTFSTTPAPSIYADIELFRLFREHLNGLHVCRCDDCEQKLFLKDRSNQVFCSNRCKWRHAQRHRPGRIIPPERFGKRGRPPGAGSPASSKLVTTKGRRHDKKKRTR